MENPNDKKTPEELGFRGVIKEVIAEQFGVRVITTLFEYKGDSGYGYLNK